MIKNYNKKQSCIQDINDSVPTFTSPAEGFVTENRPPNTVVMSVTTVDADEGDNAAIEYFITSSDSDNFDIGRLDGILRTKVVICSFTYIYKSCRDYIYRIYTCLYFYIYC